MRKLSRIDKNWQDLTRIDNSWTRLKIEQNIANKSDKLKKWKFFVWRKTWHPLRLKGFHDTNTFAELSWILAKNYPPRLPQQGPDINTHNLNLLFWHEILPNNLDLFSQNLSNFFLGIPRFSPKYLPNSNNFLLAAATIVLEYHLQASSRFTGIHDWTTAGEDDQCFDFWCVSEICMNLQNSTCEKTEIVCGRKSPKKTARKKGEKKERSKVKQD